MAEYDGFLQLNQPFKFKNVCTIYPISIESYIKQPDTFWNELCLPFALSREYLGDMANQFSLYEIVISDEKLLTSLIVMIQLLCQPKNIESKNGEIFIDDNTESLNSDNFEEFSDIVLTILQREKLKNIKEQMPKFESEEGKRRWLKLQEQRKRNANRQPVTTISDIIRVVQLGGNCYIPDKEILNWTYWKLIKTYQIIQKRNEWEQNFDIYLRTGDAKIVTPHWMEQINNI